MYCSLCGDQALYQECRRTKDMEITFDVAGPTTPQRNGIAERKFQTYYRRVRTMLNGAGLKNEKIRNGVWAECATTATYLSKIYLRHN